MLSPALAIEHDSERDFAHSEQVRLFGSDLLRRMQANPLIAPWLDRQLARLQRQYCVGPVQARDAAVHRGTIVTMRPAGLRISTPATGSMGKSFSTGMRRMEQQAEREQILPPAA
jgi:hypothetical protein